MNGWVSNNDVIDEYLKRLCDCHHTAGWHTKSPIPSNIVTFETVRLMLGPCRHPVCRCEGFREEDATASR